jgi:hypothetical protein
MHDEQINQGYDEAMHRIIRLKRYEQPPEGYCENFLREFHQRQRAELLKPSLRTLIMERISSLMSEFRVPAFAYAGATAIAVVASLAILRVNPAMSTSRAAFVASYSRNVQTPYGTPSRYQTPITIDGMQPVSLHLDTSALDNPSRLFPTSYSLQAHPASHESPLSF